MKIDEKVALILERFKGNRSAYGERYTNGEGKAGYKLVENRLSTEVIQRHIDGQQPIMVYLIQEDHHTVRFAAFDFDNKKDKPEQARYFSDVKKLTAVLDEVGMPYAIARSSTEGFHVYIFFESDYPAYKFRAFAFAAFERTGFMEEMRRGIKTLPEIYPKQDFTSAGPGNGIRVPMTESNFGIERNCWVDSNNIFIKDQWQYLKHIPKITSTQFDVILDKLGVDTSKYSNSYSYKSISGPTSKNEFPMESFSRILKGCEALRSVVDRARYTSPNHHEGNSLISILRQFKGWREWFRANVTGWDVTAEDTKQIDHFDMTGYKPHTCRYLQHYGVCRFKNENYCMNSRKDSEGRNISPSPIRFATKSINYGALAREILSTPLQD